MRHAAMLATVVAGMATSIASADVITSWTNFGQPGDQAASPVNVEAANVTGVAITRGAGLNPSGAGNSISSNGWDDLAADDYFTFGFNVDAGFSVDLDTLWIGTRSSNTGPGFLGLFYSGDGFSSNLYTFTQSGTSFNNSIIDLSSLTGLTGNVEFRIIALNGTSANGGTISSGGTFRIGDHFDGANFSEVRFEGTVVPTPGAMALFGLAGVCAGRRRR
ncbi:MAG: PEP-CTERM sorting domain-containing protein [Phycisphaerales bacterium]